MLGTCIFLVVVLAIAFIIFDPNDGTWGKWR